MNKKPKRSSKKYSAQRHAKLSISTRDSSIQRENAEEENTEEENAVEEECAELNGVDMFLKKRKSSRRRLAKGKDIKGRRMKNAQKAIQRTKEEEILCFNKERSREIQAKQTEHSCI